MAHVTLKGGERMWNARLLHTVTHRGETIATDQLRRGITVLPGLTGRMGKGER